MFILLINKNYMEEQIQNNQGMSPEMKKKHKSKFLMFIVANVVISIVVSIVVVSIMQADLRVEIKEIQEKTNKIKIGK